MISDFSPEKVAELSTYVAEVVSAIQQGNAYFGNAVRISRTAGRFHIHDCEFQ